MKIKCALLISSIHSRSTNDDCYCPIHWGIIIYPEQLPIYLGLMLLPPTSSLVGKFVFRVLQDFLLEGSLEIHLMVILVEVRNLNFQSFPTNKLSRFQALLGLLEEMCRFPRQMLNVRERKILSYNTQFELHLKQSGSWYFCGNPEVSTTKVEENWKNVRRIFFKFR